MVYLFDRPILPFYNKGKNLSFVVIIFISFFLIKRLRRFHFANLEKDANLVAGESDIRVFQTHYGWWHDTEGFASLHPRLRATRFARAFDLSGRAAVTAAVVIKRVTISLSEAVRQFDGCGVGMLKGCLDRDYKRLIIV